MILLLVLVVEDKDNAVTGKIDVFRCPFAMRGFEVEMLGEKQSIFVQQKIVTSKTIACFRDKLHMMPQCKITVTFNMKYLRNIHAPFFK